MHHARRTADRAPSISPQSPVTGVDAPHVTGVKKNHHIRRNVECMSDLLLSIVGVVQARPVPMHGQLLFEENSSDL